MLTASDQYFSNSRNRVKAMDQLLYKNYFKTPHMHIMYIGRELKKAEPILGLQWGGGV